MPLPRRRIVDEHPFVAMDTEFPGVVVRSVGSYQRSGQFHYANLRHNVNMLKLIQASAPRLLPRILLD